MSSFVWPPSLEQLQSGGVQSYLIGATFTGVIVGGSGGAQRGWGAIVGSGGVAVGGTPDIQHFNFFNTFRYFPDGGLIVGGVGTLPAKFIPDPDFPGGAESVWSPDIDFPGEAIGGN